MACDQKTRLLISCYADGETTPEETTRAKAHLDECSECRKMIAEWEEQRKMFEWAYTTVLSEEPDRDWKQELAIEMKSMPRSRRFAWPRISLSQKWAGAMAAAVIAGLVIHHFATLEPMLNVGERIATAKVSASARMQGGIQLIIGPDTIIRRISDRTIRLDRGWIDATVRGESGLHIITKRIEVVDQGTVFRVGSGPKMDFVVVEEGSVTVTGKSGRKVIKAEQALFARDGAKPIVASSPYENSVKNEQGFLISTIKEPFHPETGDTLDWYDETSRLATRFPTARFECSWSGGPSLINGLEVPRYTSMAAGLRHNLHAHFRDIATAMGGGSIGSNEWEIPVVYIKTSGLIGEPNLPADTYYVRLASKGGKVVWRFTGSMGSVAESPFTVGSIKPDYRDDQDGILAECSEDHTVFCVVKPGSPAFQDYKLGLPYWPKDMRPILHLKMVGRPVSESQKGKNAMLAEMVCRIPKTTNLTVGSSKMLYLDPARKRRILIAWNSEAGNELCRVFDLAKQGRSGSAIIGAVMSDAPLVEPHLNAGIYLLKFVHVGQSNASHIEIVTLDENESQTHALKAQDLGNSSGGLICGVITPPGYDDLELTYGVYNEKDASFPFRFQVCSRKNGREAKTLAEGLIRVKKP